MTHNKSKSRDEHWLITEKKIREALQQAKPTSPTIQHAEFRLSERLPPFIKAPCNVVCHFSFAREADYYLLHMEVDAELIITCQRCLSDFNYLYHNSVIIALCTSEAIADRIMTHYESVVLAPSINLDDLIIDELFLYAPQKHESDKHCMS